MRKEPNDDVAAFHEGSKNLPGDQIPIRGDFTPGGDSTQIGSRTVARILVITDALPDDTPDPTLPSVRSDIPASSQTLDPATQVNSNGVYNGNSANSIDNIILSTQNSSGERSEGSVVSSPLQFVNVLVEAGHVVSLITRRDWKLGLVMAARDKHAPELVIVNAGRDSRDLAALTELCRDIKISSTPHCASLLVALPPIRKEDRARMAAIPALQDAGVDDFFSATALDCEILARISSLVHMARLRGELDATREHLRLHLQTDDVTRLLNRRFFFQAAHREYGRARRYDNELSCLMINVDFFKRFYAMFGYDCGDYVLRGVAGVLRDSTRDSDIVARFSEDKFVLMLPETPIEGAISLGENIQRFINENEFNWQGQNLPVSVSIGEAARRRDEAAGAVDASDVEDEGSVALSLREELAELLEEADAALFVAKRGVRSPFGRADSNLQNTQPPASLQLPDDTDTLDELPTLLD